MNKHAVQPKDTVSYILRSPGDVVYDIRGTSNKLSESQMKNLIAGRKRIVELAKENPNLMYINGSNVEKRAALTFDDGPDSKVTPRILDILKENNIRASFFFLGTQMDYFPEVVKRAFREGHLILNHSYNHPHFTQIDSKDIKNQINATDNKIKGLTGRKPGLLRPPYGETNGNVLAAARETNKKIIIWSTDTMDWVPGADKQTVLVNVLGNVRNGEIILMHSGPGQRIALEALPDIIRGLRTRGFNMVDLGALTGVNPYFLT